MVVGRGFEGLIKGRPIDPDVARSGNLDDAKTLVTEADHGIDSRVAAALWISDGDGSDRWRWWQ
eukprot:9495818-Pyramimonas_sp.AAC.1